MATKNVTELPASTPQSESLAHDMSKSAMVVEPSLPLSVGVSDRVKAVPLVQRQRHNRPYSEAGQLSTSPRYKPYENERPSLRKSPQNSPADHGDVDADEQVFSSSPYETPPNGSAVAGSGSPTSKISQLPRLPETGKEFPLGKENTNEKSKIESLAECLKTFPSHVSSSPLACHNKFEDSKFEGPYEIHAQPSRPLKCTVNGTPPTPPIPVPTKSSPPYSRERSRSQDEPPPQDRSPEPPDKPSASKLIAVRHFQISRKLLRNYAYYHRRDYMKIGRKFKLHLRCICQPTLTLSLCGEEDDFSFKLIANSYFPAKCSSFIMNSIVKLSVKVMDGRSDSVINEGNVTFALKEKTAEIRKLIQYSQPYRSECVAFILKVKVSLCEFHPDDKTTFALSTSDFVMNDYTDFPYGDIIATSTLAQL